MNRGCGLFMPISALPNKYGYGCFSKEAYDFIDYLGSLNIKYWHIESLNIFDYSLKNVVSSFAGEPLYIDIEKYLTVEEIEFFKLNNNLSFEEYKEKKNEVLRYLFDKMYYSTNIDKFIENNESWIYDYAVFMVLKDELNLNYNDFPVEYKNIDSKETILFIKTHSEEIIYYIFIQYLFFKQWKELKKYASLKGVKIISTINFAISNDSSDIYSNKNLFNLNENKYSFNMESIKKQKYKYFTDIIKFASNIYDYVILEINSNISSKYIKEVENEITNVNIKNIIIDNNYYNQIINEKDFNIINNTKLNLQVKNAFYGFAYSDKESLPNNYNKKIISYLGINKYKPLIYCLKDKLICEKLSNYLNLNNYNDESILIKMAIENIFASNADVCIIDIRDILFEDTNVYEFMNFNYKLKKNYQNENLFLYLKELIKNKNR